MAATPESKVKKKVHAVLKEYGAYAVNYIGGQYANAGTPDILVCYKKHFIGIECKAGRGKLTMLQFKNLRDIHNAMGLALVINETNLSYLESCLNVIKTYGHAQSNYELFEPTQKDTQ
jgi:hypothetical protein